VLTADGNSIEKSVPLSMTLTARDSDPVFIGAAGRLYFLAAGSTISLRNIWSVDPATLEMTKVASDVFEPTDVVGFNDTLYFVSSRNDVGRELFKINGSEVALAHDIRPGISSSFPSNLTVVAGELFLSADDGNSGREIWRVHGTNGSQLSLAEDIWPGLNLAE
jgi:ELWxxDGT repeat protein